MRPLPQFGGLDPRFWAHVRLVSERLGYSVRAKKGQPKRLRGYTIDEIVRCLEELELDHDNIVTSGSGSVTVYGKQLLAYLNERRRLLEDGVAPFLMDRAEAAVEFERLRTELNPGAPFP